MGAFGALSKVVAGKAPEFRGMIAFAMARRPVAAPGIGYARPGIEAARPACLQKARIDADAI
ncbi:hypothetical protein D0B32_10810 [Paraburkholderia sp. DHOC27]|nr:hypothetical protein D0B32_10810 [Paraburkholderia sp. DHOC27]